MSDVKLVWITPDAQHIIAKCARVSNPANQENRVTEPKLLKYLATHRHWSPFEMASMCLEITTTRDISAQIIRHRTFSFQEFCISGDSLITCVIPTNVADQKVLAKRKIADLYEAYKNGKLVCKVLTLDTNSSKFEETSIREVFKTGLKECVTLTCENGNKLTCTVDHKLCSEKFDFTPVKDLKISDYLYTYNVTNSSPCLSKIVQIEPAGMLETYDLEVDHASHNYIANDFCTHNSQRYATALDYELPHFRLQDTKNRQNSLDCIDEATQSDLQAIAQNVISTSFAAYNDLISKGVAKETARKILPLCTSTTIFMAGTIRSWIHYVQVRGHDDTQKEHRDIALAAKQILLTHLPSLSELLSN
jgi:thymidylate synthase ThyX